MKFSLAHLLATLALLTIYSPSSHAEKRVKTKVVVQSVSEKNIQRDAPCFIVYPEGVELEILEASGADDLLKHSLEEMGYTITTDDRSAVVFVRVDFTQHESFETEISFKERPHIDYTNSASSKNYAAMVGGGRYKKLLSPDLQKGPGDPSSILGPEGEIIDLAEQGKTGAEFKEGRKGTLSATVRPITFQVSAWSFHQVAANQNPKQLWAVQTTYNNLYDEGTEPQLKDLCKIASRFFGKNLRKEKLVARK